MIKNFLASFIKNAVFANVAVVMILAAGFVSVMNMVREAFPEFSLDIITIHLSCPGADPEDIEKGISLKVEEAMEKIEGIESYSTFSREGLFLANIEVKQDYNGSEVLDNVRTEVNSISTFPLNAERPVIKELMLQDPIALIYISGGTSERAMKKLSLQIKKEVQRLPAISKVKVFGDRKYEIFVEVCEKNLRKYGVSLLDIANSIAKNNQDSAAGKICTDQEEIRIRTVGKKHTEKEIASMVVVATPQGGSVPLNRLAVVNNGFGDDAVEVNVDGKLAMLLIVYKTKEEDSLAISDAVNTYIERKSSSLPEGFKLEILYDNTNMLRSRINLLIKNGLLGLGIVFLSLWVFLNSRLSFWAGMGILVSISGSLTVLFLLGETINMVSLFGLIMVLGIVVDDAIVVGEAIYFNRQRGESAFNSALNGVCEVGLPVLTSVGTTIVAFLPLLYVGGIMGKFISILPLVVIVCLIVSLSESLLLLPAHLSKLPNPSFEEKSSNIIFLRISNIKNIIANKINWVINHAYNPFLIRALNWRYVSLSIAVALLLVTIGLIRGQILKFEVFPSIDDFIMTATIEFPEGTPLSVTKAAIKQVDDALVSLVEKEKIDSSKCLIKSRVSIAGETLEAIPNRGSHLGSVQAVLLGYEKRGIHSDQLTVLWEKEIGKILGIKSLKIEWLSGGPPGEPIEIWLQGSNINVLSKAAKELKEHLERYDGVYQVCSDFSLGRNEIQLVLKPEARHLGLNLKDLIQQVNAAYYGVEAISFQRGESEVKLKVRYSEDKRNQISDIYKMNIRISEGHYIPLTSIAIISFAPGYSRITRTNGLRRIAVSAGVDSSKVTANEVFGELANGCFISLSKKYPEISIVPQGEKKKMRESLSSLIIGFPVAIIGMFVIIAATFRSYLQPFVIMITIPFGLIGAVMGHLLLGYNMSIMSIFGMVALTGIVVNDAIVMIERINGNLARGMVFSKAVLDGSRRRVMAIFLTTISTVGGLTPIIFETDLQAKFLIPMALSIASGVAFASILTLVLVPSLLTILSDIRVVVKKIISGKWEQRELLEPARNRLIKNIR